MIFENESEQWPLLATRLEQKLVSKHCSRSILMKAVNEIRAELGLIEVNSFDHYVSTMDETEQVLSSSDASRKNIIKVQDVLMTTPSYPAHDGYDEKGNELEIETFKVELLFEDGRKYAHKKTGDERFIKNLEDRIRRHGTINLEHWHMIRGVQDYSQK